MSKEKEKRDKKPWKTWQKVLLTVVIIVIGVPLLYVIFGLTLMTVTEYKPDDVEDVEVTGDASGNVETGTEYKIMTWNIGYGALGDNADFFLDGGSSVKTADKARTSANMEGIANEVAAINPDFLMMQEVDTKAARSNRVNEYEYVSDATGYVDNTFAYNYRVVFLPYPMPPIGKVNAGLATFANGFDITSATRVQLPNPFEWPWRQGNLKRCIVMNRVPVAGTDKELVVVNLHLEAYDSGEGKVAQTNMLREYLEAEVDAGNYVIAGGDFNQIFSDVDSSAYPVYEGMWQPGEIDVEDFMEHFTCVMDDAAPSCRSLDKAYVGADPETFQYYIIDGFIVSDNVEIVSYETQDLGFVNTDHNPVVLEFALEK